MEQIVIDIIGYAGSGKSTVCKQLQQEYGFYVYRPSDTLRAFAATHGIELKGRKDYVASDREMIKQDPLAIIRPVLESSEPRILVDGLRNPIPFQALREKYKAILIYLEAPIEIRLGRLQADHTRTGHRLPPNLEALRSDEEPDEYNPDRHLTNMREMAEMADYTVDASGTPEDGYRRVKAIIDQILADAS